MRAYFKVGGVLLSSVPCLVDLSFPRLPSSRDSSVFFIMISKLSFAALSLVGLSSGSVLRRNDTVKGPLQQLRPVQGSGVLKIPVTKVDPSGNFTKRQDVDPLLNVYNGYLIDSKWL